MVRSCSLVSMFLTSFIVGFASSSQSSNVHAVNRSIGFCTLQARLADLHCRPMLHAGRPVKVNEMLELGVLLYNPETWTLNEEQIRRLKIFEMSCLRKLGGVTGRDIIRKEEIYNRLHLSRNIVDRIQQRRLRYFGHVSWMGKSGYPKEAMEDYVHGQRNRGRPKKRWMDMVWSDCSDMGLSIQDAALITQDRNSWRNVIGELPLCAPASSRHWVK